MKGTDNSQISDFNALPPPSSPNPIFTLMFGLLHVSQLEHSRVAGPCQALPQSETLLEIALYFYCDVTISQIVKYSVHSLVANVLLIHGFRVDMEAFTR